VPAIAVERFLCPLVLTLMFPRCIAVLTGTNRSAEKDDGVAAILNELCLLTEVVVHGQHIVQNRPVGATHKQRTAA
jgi:hypothetical protein